MRNTQARSAKKERDDPTAIEEAEVTIKVEDLVKSHQPANVLLAGPSGHGKSVLASFAPRNTILSTESGGTISAKAVGLYNPAKVIHTEIWEEVVAGKRWADQHLKAGDWLTLDSLTKMQELMIRWILRKKHEANSSRDLDIPAIADHQKWQKYFKRFVDGLIDAPYNVTFICGEMIREGRDGDDIVLPHIEGKGETICDYIRGQTSLNIYYAITTQAEDENGMPVRRALFQPYMPLGIVFPKDRFHLFGQYRDVYHEEFDIFASWVVEIEEKLAAIRAAKEAQEARASRPVAAATPIRRRRAAS
jgi:hypothetical protein